jgi:hypothetical protein
LPIANCRFPLALQDIGRLSAKLAVGN